MNTIKTSFLMLALGLSVASCAAETSAADIDAIKALQDNPFVKAGVVLDRGITAGRNIIEHGTNAVLTGAEHADTYVRMYPYKVVGMAIGGTVLGTVIGLAALAQYMRNKRVQERAQAYECYTVQYYENCKKQQEEAKRAQEEADHTWVQQQRYEEEKQKTQYTYGQCYMDARSN